MFATWKHERDDGESMVVVVEAYERSRDKAIEAATTHSEVQKFSALAITWLRLRARKREGQEETLLSSDK